VVQICNHFDPPRVTGVRAVLAQLVKLGGREPATTKRVRDGHQLYGRPELCGPLSVDPFAPCPCLSCARMRAVWRNGVRYSSHKCAWCVLAT
jgi:hypothetical protein